MVLPPRLSRRYDGRFLAYHQTASKIEQLALASYISQGYLEKHLRRRPAIVKPDEVFDYYEVDEADLQEDTE